MRLKRFYGKYFVLGCVFLMNPIVSLFDVLPDFIGCLLIATSLKEISVLESRLENAMRQMYYLAGLSAARFGLMLFVFDMDSSWVLSCVTLLGAAEVFFFLYFLSSFFGGITYLAQRCESENVLSVVDNVKSIGFVFCVARTACTVIPQLAALPELTLDHDPSSLKGLTPELLTLYKNYAIVLLFIVSLAVGIWWLKETAAFIKGVRKDEAFKASLEKRYGEYVGDVPLEETFITLKGVWCVFISAALFCANMRFYNEWSMYGTLIIPGWVGTLLFAYTVIRLGGSLKLIFPYGLLMAAQISVGYFVKGNLMGDIGTAITGVAIFLSAFCAEWALARYTEERLDLDIRGMLLAQRIVLGVHVAFSVAYSFTDITLLHTGKVLSFVAWIALVVRTFSAVSDYIKALRRYK